ncbi:hypothetical protein J4760_11105 [Salinicoccus sp. ID82-1]|uniref:aggregation-promoting factor C-terminal-like domain-containing protein n=1 Tax=Salinicoccus sp. ID82-1 TaxID=2820269 RepID=UPI001F3FF022|nr:hypothetical protein [Salinicoccus sp. ID82-1]MCG1010568.1 hypothetical protein [Salinicoccus sp. ID82-1]
MKKTILTTTLALGLGITGITSGQTADASTHEINKQELAEMALANSSELNNAPIHEGAYDYDFTLNGVDYSFESNGTSFTWAYNSYGDVQPQQEVQVQEPVEQEVQAQEPVQQEVQVQEPVQQEVEVQQPEPEYNVQEVSNTQQQTETTQAAAPQQSTGGSTKEQFLAAGGTEAMWQNIVLPESSGNPNAVNPLGYRGLGQTKEAWGTGSVETQTKGMINYAQERYGSVEAAMDFRAQNNWW